jgi:NAD(P)H dehydrogenase (quinone)
MRVLYIYCHPLPESFHAAIRASALDRLKAAGHAVDLLDLYAEGFNPVLSEDARRHYHDTSRNQKGLEDYVRRLQAAEALVVQFPVWCFGMPAMLKGFLDRMMMPGVAFDISDPARVKPTLGNIKRIAGITTYGRPWWMALAMGDPPRKIVKRYLPWFADRRARVDYYALYHMNVASASQRAAFLEKVGAAMARLN